MVVSSRGFQLICHQAHFWENHELKKNTPVFQRFLPRQLSGSGKAASSPSIHAVTACNALHDDGSTSSFVHRNYVQDERTVSKHDGPDACVPYSLLSKETDDERRDEGMASNSSSTAMIPSNDAGTLNSLKPGSLPNTDGYGTCDRKGQHDFCVSSIPPKVAESEPSSNIRRFSLNQYAIQNPQEEQLQDLEHLLCDSYSELMWGPFTYRPALAWILSMYLRERQAYLPHAVMLVGLYNSSEELNDDEGGIVTPDKWWLAGAVEVSFNASGKPKDLQTPVPPEDAPFLSNMAVLKKFRRRGIGRELLKAAEQLASQMGGKEMYLHCRMIDEAPLNMYTNAGYVVFQTDSILSFLLFQRRRHLMCKTLAKPSFEETLVQRD